MRSPISTAICVLFALNSTASAATITFDEDPFLGSDALTTPGRQVVGDELFVEFDPVIDVFEFADAAFSPYGFGPPFVVVNDEIDGVPPSGANVIVLRTFDSDADLTTPFNAGTAATLIAAQVTSPGAGVFIYFNQNLDLPRLVFSTDLDDPTADLKILARMTNLGGDAGKARMVDFRSANFAAAAAVPEPGTLLLMAASGLIWAAGARRRRG